MTWNHRVIRREEGLGDDIEVWFSIHECFYDNPRDEIPTSWTQDPIAPVGETPQELLVTLNDFMEAMKQPILEIDGDKLKIWKEKP